MILHHQANRFLAAKRSFVTRRVNTSDMQSLIMVDSQPKAGDLVLVRVLALGHHTKSERIDGRRGQLFVGDELILAYGNRYAPDQFEAVVPDDLGECHMVAAGGIAGIALSAHHRMDEPTRVLPLGLIGDSAGQVINLHDYRVTPELSLHAVPSIAVVGTSMNAGKTTSAAHIIRGLAAAGYQVGAMKVTGTGAGGDLWLMKDAGAFEAVDFTDAGYPTTFNVDLSSLISIVDTLSSYLISKGAQAIVVEIADGVYQRETSALLANPSFIRRFNHVVFAAREALSATNGVNTLGALGYRVPAVSGLLCASPLAQREAAERLPTPVYGLEDLIQPQIATSLLFQPVVQLKAANA